MRGRIQQACFCVVFFNDPATTEIYTLSLHDALPIWILRPRARPGRRDRFQRLPRRSQTFRDRKSTRLNSSHHSISYSVFCLKKRQLARELTMSLFPHSVETSRNLLKGVTASVCHAGLAQLHVPDFVGSLPSAFFFYECAPP